MKEPRSQPAGEPEFDGRSLIFQVTGRQDGPPVIYLPGVHGDWTPTEAARPLLSERLRLVETAYPRVDHWCLPDFTRALDQLLDTLGYDSAHLIGESFGSLVGWRFGTSRPERVRSLVLLAGFCQPPRWHLAGLARRLVTLVPTPLWEWGIDVHTWRKLRRGERRSRLGAQQVTYAAMRGTSGRRALARRMAIIQQTDLRSELGRVRFPVRYLVGTADRLIRGRRELETLEHRLPSNCDFQSHIVPAAPHPLIATHAETVSRQIIDWVLEIEESGFPNSR